MYSLPPPPCYKNNRQYACLPALSIPRVRVALDGVNCTLGGSLAALRRHIDGVKANAILQGGGIDFKLSASRGARNSQVFMWVGMGGSVSPLFLLADLKTFYSQAKEPIPFVKGSCDGTLYCSDGL